MKSVAQVLYRRLRASSALAPAFSPSELFASGEQGVWYDNSSYLTTMFQDAAGTTPVTGLEQPVGLRLDKSKGLTLGSELVTNGDFSSSTGWTINGGGVSITGGALTASTAVTANIYSTISPASTTRTFKVSWTIATATAGDVILRLYNNGANVTVAGFAYLGTPGTYTAYVQTNAAPNQAWITIGGGGFTGTIDNISVRELPGNHASQSTAASRPVLSARYNLLTRTEAFDNGAWLKPNATITADQATSPTGTNTADRLAEKTATATPNVFQVVGTNPAGTYSYSCAVKKDTQRYAIVSFAQSGGAYTAACVDLDDGTITKSGVSTGVTAPAVPTSVSLGDGWYRVTVYGTTTAALNSVAVQPSDTANPTFGAFGDYSYLGDSTKAIYIWGADLRVSNESSALPAYQRVGAAVNGTSTSIGTPDYDTTGFPVYLRYDGGDWYQTNSIDFSAGATNPPALGPNLNPGFAAYSVVLTGTWSASGSNYVFTDTVGGQQRPGVSWPVSTLPVGTYKLDVVVASITGATQIRMDGVGAADILLGVGTTSRIVTVTTLSTPRLRIEDTSTTIGDGFAITSVSVVAVDANYAPDKMSVFTGVRKLSDTNTGTVAQLSSSTVTNNGIFGVYAPFNTGASADYAFISKGTTRVIVDSDAFVGPETVVLTGLGDISGPAAILRRNSLQIAASSSSQGTGNYGAYVLNIGTGSGEYTGRDYGLIIVGRTVTAPELANTENYMETQTFGKDMAYVYTDELTTALGDPITAADGDPIYMSVTYA